MTFQLALLGTTCLAFLYISLIRPNTKRKNRLKPFMAQLIAHRGLFCNSGPAPENSIAAFKAAMDKQYGIELDVHLTIDNHLIVFHDETLERMCGEEIEVSQSTYEELLQFTLLNSNERIPLLSEVLELVDGKVPLIIELKTDKINDHSHKKLCTESAKMLGEYKGNFTVQSFNPLVVLWFKRKFPEMIRGQLSTHYRKDNESKGLIVDFLLTNLLLNIFTKPDYIAYNQLHSNQFSYMLCKKLYKPVNVGWTIRNQEQFEKATNECDIIIFDTEIPEEKQKH